MRARVHLCEAQRITNGLTTFWSVQLMQRRVVVTEERACAKCHMRISNKMLAVYPNGVLVCFKCSRKGDPSICPVSGQDFGT